MKYIAILITVLSNFTFAGVDLVKVEKSINKLYLLDGDKVVKEYHVAFGGDP